MKAVMTPVFGYVRKLDWGRTKVPIGIAAVGLLVWTAWPLAIVPSGHRGVMTTMGKPSETVYGEGLHLRMPVLRRASR